MNGIQCTSYVEADRRWDTVDMYVTLPENPADFKVFIDKHVW